MKSYIKLRNGIYGNGIPLFSLRTEKEVWSLPKTHYAKYCIVSKNDRMPARHGDKVEVKIITESEMNVLRNIHVYGVNHDNR